MIKETIEIQDIQQSINDGDFVGVKVGDVDLTAQPNNLVSIDERTAGTLLFDLNDREVRTGEEVEVTFTADQAIKGYQFTLNLNGLEAQSFAGGTTVSEENFGVFADAVTTSWDAPSVFTGKAQFTLRFKATRNGKLSEMMRYQAASPAQ